MKYNLMQYSVPVHRLEIYNKKDTNINNLIQAAKWL
jgi:hypothetical protein